MCLSPLWHQHLNIFQAVEKVQSSELLEAEMAECWGMSSLCDAGGFNI